MVLLKNDGIFKILYSIIQINSFLSSLKIIYIIKQLLILKFKKLDAF